MPRPICAASRANCERCWRSVVGVAAADFWDEERRDCFWGFVEREVARRRWVWARIERNSGVRSWIEVVIVVVAIVVEGRWWREKEVEEGARGSGCEEGGSRARVASLEVLDGVCGRQDARTSWYECFVL